jgi:hypothetical protein
LASKSFRIKSLVEIVNVNDPPVVVAGQKKVASKMISSTTFETRLSAPQVDPAAPLTTGRRKQQQQEEE